MKVILTEKIIKWGNVGDIVDVATGYARNYLFPNGKAIRYSRENIAVFESKRAELVAKQESARKSAESLINKVKDVKFYMIRQAGDTGHLYGSVSSRDIARMLSELAGVAVESHQVLLGAPIKSIGAFDTKIALHPDVVVPIKVFVAQTQDEIDALVAGKVLTFGTKKIEEGKDTAFDAANKIGNSDDERPSRGKKSSAESEAVEAKVPEAVAE
jgi:large subunit ribosomal protein L9